MHSEWHERKAQKLREEAAKELEKRAGYDKKAAEAEQKAYKAEEAAAKTSSDSTRRSKLREAERRRDDCNRARMQGAKHTKRAADAQRKAAEEEKAAASARRSEHKAEERRSEHQRKKEARERERAEQRRQRGELARVDDLERRTRDIETALTAARSAAPEKVTILFLAGNPKNRHGSDLRLDREVWEIRDKLLRTEFRSVINFEVHPAARLTDVTEALNRYRPDVVHFSGHGSDDVLVFDDPQGDPQPVDFSHFGMLLQAASKPILLALFNACNSSDQAEMACDFLDAAIGMDASIEDDDAKAFAGAFYNSLGYANSVDTAFRQAVAHVKSTRGRLTGEPQLHVKPGVRADEMVIVAP